MDQYRTLKEICKRTNWKRPERAIKALRDEGFPMYTQLEGQPPKYVWITDDELISQWL